MDNKQSNISVYVSVIGMIFVLADKYELSVLYFLQASLPYSLFLLVVVL